MDSGDGKRASALRHYLRDDSGPTAIEYALIGGAIAVVIAAAVLLLGNQLQVLYQQIVGGFG